MLLQERWIVLLALFLLFFVQCKQPAPQNDTSSADSTIIIPSDTLWLLFMGDIMQHLPQVSSAYDPKTNEHNYMHCFKYMKKYWNQANFVIGNLETTLDNSNFSGYPMFCSPYQLVRDLQKSGLTTLVTANNHSLDRGIKGLRKTIAYLDSIGIQHVGVSLDSNRLAHRLLHHPPFKIALLNYTYGTNGIPTPKGAVVPLLDTLLMKQDIEVAKKDSVTNIIVFLHWGDEYAHHPNVQQGRIGDFLQRHGVDMIVGSHPHVVQPMQYDTLQGDTTGIRIYSLGNFISNQHYRYTNAGVSAVVRLVRRQDKTSYRLRYINHFTYKYIHDGRLRYTVVPASDMDSISDTISKKTFSDFIRHTHSLMDSSIHPINNVLIRHDDCVNNNYN